LQEEALREEDKEEIRKEDDYTNPDQDEDDMVN